jgi:hypothetical protein
VSDWYITKSEEDFVQRKGHVEFVEMMMLRAADYRDKGDLDRAGDWRNQGLKLAREFDVSEDDEMDGRARGMFGPFWREPL